MFGIVAAAVTFCNILISSILTKIGLFVNKKQHSD